MGGRVPSLSQKTSPVAPLPQKTSPVAPLSQKTSPVAPLSQWLQLMLAEIARKREELERAHAEAAHRSADSASHAAGTGRADEMPT